ncbi:MAG: zinc metallopeptidase [Chitinivibrionales bacterium]|nr:zinc metallopeptidase [Chitinivibrionales bacterium]MBD3357356.1 zinc metallopeptidase [Chitinivibrionales bacterium]
MLWFDPAYLLFALPGLLLALWASYKTKSTFSRYSRVASRQGLTGAQAAMEMLRRADIDNVKVEEVSGFLSDHYDPMSRTLRLSPNVYRGSSLSAIGVACHEAGHAVQHAVHFAPLHLRSALVPATNVSSSLSYIVIMMGLFFSQKLILLGALLFSVAVLFSLVTLPVEWDASARAKRMMVRTGVVTEREALDAGKVLNAAFLTYLAAAVSSLLTLLYYLMRAGVFSGDD